jgi:hypothetical protein
MWLRQRWQGSSQNRALPSQIATFAALQHAPTLSYGYLSHAMLWGTNKRPFHTSWSSLSHQAPSQLAVAIPFAK